MRFPCVIWVQPPAAAAAPRGMSGLEQQLASLVSDANRVVAQTQQLAATSSATARATAAPTSAGASCIIPAASPIACLATTSQAPPRGAGTASASAPAPTAQARPHQAPAGGAGAALAAGAPNVFTTYKLDGRGDAGGGSTADGDDQDQGSAVGASEGGDGDGGDDAGESDSSEDELVDDAPKVRALHGSYQAATRQLPGSSHGW
jgi:hypothetical protein